MFYVYVRKLTFSAFFELERTGHASLASANLKMTELYQVDNHTSGGQASGVIKLQSFGAVVRIGLYYFRPRDNGGRTDRAALPSATTYTLFCILGSNLAPESC